MSFLFRRLSARRRSNNERSKSCPPRADQGDNGAGERNSEQSRARLGIASNGEEAGAFYDDRIDELGQIMASQGQCIDELTSRSRQMSIENAMLRERLHEHLTASSKPVATSSTNRSPLKNIANHKRSSGKDNDHQQLVRKLKEDNALLVTQADLLSAELAEANKTLEEKDGSITSLGKELATCLEKARTLLAEKKTWKAEMFQKTKQVESFEIDVKRATSLSSEASQRANQYLTERKELEKEVEDLTSQMTGLATKVEDQHMELVSKEGVIEKLSTDLARSIRSRDAAKEEAKTSAETMVSIKESLRRTKMLSEQLEAKLKLSEDKLAEGRLLQHTLQTANAMLEGEVDAFVEKEKELIAGWTKGQAKIIASLKEKQLSELQSQQQILVGLRRANASLEGEHTACKRDLQCCQQRNTSLEKLLAARENEHRDSLKAVLNRATETESQLETNRMLQKELRQSVSTLEEKLVGAQLALKDSEAKHTRIIGDLQKEVQSMKEENQTLASRVPSLEEDVARSRKNCEVDKKRVQEEAARNLRDLDIECETLRVAIKDEKLKNEDTSELLGKQSAIHRAQLSELEKSIANERLKLEKIIASERDVSQSLMNKLQELASKMQALMGEKYKLDEQAKNDAGKICALENIIANGEVKISNLAKQLAVSMDDQERQMAKEVELKKELNVARRRLGSLRSQQHCRV